ncbi:hypothetical protein B0J12DRAFT_698416 [Macrophomina phaseolina]|uniref:Uncharacterized protein n=1 Tax=Macrophomina phaseolina TaxID=35725 RepID=A0ABQ8GH40_9PEZI|nr:hypothetical protein B0J12DRAFT_698416 [Macrophomina phaseolina]
MYYDMEVHGLAHAPCADEESGTVVVGDLFDLNARSTMDAPLFRRGWTFQEGILSSRALCFGFGAARWFCPSAQNCNGGNIAGKKLQVTGIDPGFRRFAPLPHPIPDHIHYRIRPAHPGQWKTIVKSYGDRKLTYPSDALRAVSALA